MMQAPGHGRLHNPETGWQLVSAAAGRNTLLVNGSDSAAGILCDCGPVAFGEPKAPGDAHGLPWRAVG